MPVGGGERHASSAGAEDCHADGHQPRPMDLVCQVSHQDPRDCEHEDEVSAGQDEVVQALSVVEVLASHAPCSAL